METEWQRSEGKKKPGRYIVANWNLVYDTEWNDSLCVPAWNSNSYNRNTQEIGRNENLRQIVISVVVMQHRILD